jgi:hypothetical protein
MRQTSGDGTATDAAAPLGGTHVVAARGVSLSRGLSPADVAQQMLAQMRVHRTILQRQGGQMMAYSGGLLAGTPLSAAAAADGMASRDQMATGALSSSSFSGAPGALAADVAAASSAMATDAAITPALAATSLSAAGSHDGLNAAGARFNPPAALVGGAAAGALVGAPADAGAAASSRQPGQSLAGPADAPDGGRLGDALATAAAAAGSTLVPSPAAMAGFGAWTRGRIAELAQHLLAEVENSSPSGPAPDAAPFAAQAHLADGATQARRASGEVAAADLFSFLRVRSLHANP